MLPSRPPCVARRPAPRGWRLTAVLLAVAVAVAAAAPAPPAGPDVRALAESLLAELVGFRSTATRPAQVRAAAEAMARRLLDAGFPPDDVQLLDPGDGKASLVARYRGRGQGAPILLMAHLDVVDAEPEAWSFPPFAFGKDERYYYGRGTSDNKAGAATLVANFIRLRAEGFEPARDLIMALTGDEETDGAHIGWLVRERRDLVDAEFALNTDAGGGLYDGNGEPQVFYVQTSEKIYQSFELTATNPGGHSSVPRADNAIYQLARALVRIADHDFPIHLNDGTRVFFERTAAYQHGELGPLMLATARGDLDAAERVAAASATFNALLRTTCVATRLTAGHADNALPRVARAVVNCRILPNETPDEVEATLRAWVDDTAVTFRRVEQARPSPPSPVRPQVLEPIEQLVAEIWPGTPVIPSMSTGATDGLFVRNGGIPVYGVSAIFAQADEVRAHGLDERVGIEEFHRAVEFWYRLLRRLAG